MRCTADNKRFGARRGVRPQKVLSDFQAFAPARTFVFPALPPSRRHDAPQSLRARGASSAGFTADVLRPSGLRTSDGFVKLQCRVASPPPATSQSRRTLAASGEQQCNKQGKKNKQV
jgi:hypothetical protein